MSQTEAITPHRQALTALIQQGLLREFYRQGGLTQGQFARLMEERRGR